MSVVRESIINMIHNADFHGALVCLKQLSEVEQRDTILGEAALSDNISVLGFVDFMISQDNCYFNHMLAAEAYIQMCFIEGAYNVAMFHAWEMYKLNPDIDTQKFLLSFYGIPERVMPLEKALQIASDIIKTEPNYKPALEILGS